MSVVETKVVFKPEALYECPGYPIPEARYKQWVGFVEDTLEEDDITFLILSDAIHFFDNLSVYIPPLSRRVVKLTYVTEEETVWEQEG